MNQGSGLLVEDQLMICGTTEYEEWTVRQTSAAAGLGLPVCAGKPLKDVSPERESELRESFVLRLPGDSPGSVNYVLNGKYDYTITPGQTQTLSESRSWLVSYDKGNGTGIDKVNLEESLYDFIVEDDHWTLKPQDLRISLDNQESDQDFTVVVDNKPVTIPAGESKTLTSNRPLVMQYDRGGDAKPARKLLNKSGTLKLGVDPSTNRWDWTSNSEHDTPEKEPSRDPSLDLVAGRN